MASLRSQISHHCASGKSSGSSMRTDRRAPSAIESIRATSASFLGRPPSVACLVFVADRGAVSSVRHFSILLRKYCSARIGTKTVTEAQSGHADFSVVLVYDVSRWGRFLDADESAYHEYVCRKAGINVHYPAEQFVNDGSPISTLVKTVKRTMAAEYSRELSVKVFAGQCRLIELGYRQGGMAGYGLRRQLIAMDGTAKGLLARGEQKSFQTDRVVSCQVQMTNSLLLEKCSMPLHHNGADRIADRTIS